MGSELDMEDLKFINKFLEVPSNPFLSPVQLFPVFSGGFCMSLTGKSGTGERWNGRKEDRIGDN